MSEPRLVMRPGMHPVRPGHWDRYYPPNDPLPKCPVCAALAEDVDIAVQWHQQEEEDRMHEQDAKYRCAECGEELLVSQQDQIMSVMGSDGQPVVVHRERCDTLEQFETYWTRARDEGKVISPVGALKVLEELQRMKRLYEPSHWDRHIIEFSPEGWVIQHPLACRPALLDCDVTKVVTHKAKTWSEPPRVPGRYLVAVDGSRLVLGDSPVG